MNDIYKKMRLLDYVDFLRENCENRRCHNCIFKEKKSCMFRYKIPLQWRVDDRMKEIKKHLTKHEDDI